MYIVKSSLSQSPKKEDYLGKTFIIEQNNTAKERFLSNNIEFILHLATIYLVKEEQTTVTDRLTEALIRDLMYTTLKVSIDQINQLEPTSILNTISHPDYSWNAMSLQDYSSLQKMSSELSYSFNISKTAALSIVWPNWARMVYCKHVERFVLFAKNILSVDSHRGDKEAALMGIHEVEAFFQTLHLPTTLEDLGITSTDTAFDDLAQKNTNSDIYTLLKCL